MTALARTALQYYARYFPLSKGKNKLVGLLWKPLSFGQYNFTTNLQGSDVRISCDLTQFVQRQLYFWGAYEGQYCKHWIALAKRSSVIFDIGANVGLYSLLAAEANPSAYISAFEPTSELVEVLTGNVGLNGFQNIRINGAAVGARAGEAILRECRGSDGTNEGMNYILPNGGERQSSDQIVPIISLDAYCRANLIDRIDLMKMDIEGGEYEALLGAAGLLKSRSVGYLFIELTEWAAQRSGHSTAEITGLLYDFGYRIYRLQHSSLTEIKLADIKDGENVIASASVSALNSPFSNGAAPGN